MTTKVRVINEGPGAIVVSLINPITSDVWKAIVVPPGNVSPESAALYVYSNAIVAITEAK